MIATGLGRLEGKLPDILALHTLSCKDMPLFRPQLHRCLGVHICYNVAVFRSSNRPSRTSVAVAGRHLHHRIAATSANSNGSSSSGQGFGKPSTNQQKKQKPEVSSTADALLRSLGGKYRITYSWQFVYGAAEAVPLCDVDS